MEKNVYQRVEELEKVNERLIKKIVRLEQCLATFIIWTAQSANAPISMKEADNLLKIIPETGT